MKYKCGDYTGEKFTDGSLRIYKNNRVVCEVYIHCFAQNSLSFNQKNFESLCRAIEKNCSPYKGGIEDESM